MQAHYPGDVVFTTAASDMETVSEAVRCGVFDYLIKPIAYERLGQTLTRFRQRKHMLESIDSASQKQIDEMFNAYARGEPKDELPTGIDPLTLNAVRKLFKEPRCATYGRNGGAGTDHQPHHCRVILNIAPAAI